MHHLELGRFRLMPPPLRGISIRQLFSGQFGQLRGHHAHGSGAVAEAGFYLLAESGEGAVVLDYFEQRVVAEAVGHLWS